MKRSEERQREERDEEMLSGLLFLFAAEDITVHDKNKIQKTSPLLQKKRKRKKSSCRVVNGPQK